MDIYVADEDLVPDVLIDQYTSFVWTDRYSAYGDFSMDCTAAYYTSNLKNRRYLLASETASVMMIETATRKTQTRGNDILTITGRSIEAFMQYRSSKNNEFRKPQVVSGHLQDLITNLVKQYCVNSDPRDQIPGLQVATSAINGPDVTIAVDRGPIYDIVKNLCDSAGYGFNIGHIGGNQLLFNVYTGEDTSDPTQSNYLVYSPDAENLLNPNTLESNANLKNHARVLGAKASADVYATGTDPAVTGFNRRSMFIDAADVGSDDTTTVAQDVKVLQQKGREALADRANKYQKLVTGDIFGVSSYSQAPFALGQIVAVGDTFDQTSRSQITELVWSSDGAKTKFTPTFTAV